MLSRSSYLLPCSDIAMRSVAALSAFKHHDTWLGIRNQVSKGFKRQTNETSAHLTGCFITLSLASLVIQLPNEKSCLGFSGRDLQAITIRLKMLT
jgi:hypothetical protein